MANGAICRLCLELNRNNLDTFDSRKRRLLKTISLDLDLNLTDNPLVCSNCQSKLWKSFDFKTTCINNEEYLNTFPQSNLEELGQEKATEYEIQTVCRLCLKYYDCSSLMKLENIDKDTILVDMIRKCLPEIDLDITSQRFMCNLCKDNLRTQFDFVMACKRNEESIKKCILANGTDGKGQIDLGSVLEFIKNDDAFKVNVKVENVCEEVNCDVVMKTEEPEWIEEDEVHVKSEENYLLEVENEGKQRRLLEHPQTTMEKYKCDYCYKNNPDARQLRRHIYSHERGKRYECARARAQCGLAFKDERLLDGHVLSKHSRYAELLETIADKIYRCRICPFDKSMTANRTNDHNMRRHRRRATLWR